MRIEGTSPRHSVRRKSGSVGSGKGGAVFQAPQSSPPDQAAARGTVRAATGIDTILALQGVEDPRFSRKRAVRHAQSMLDTLEEIKADLLAGGVGEGRLNKLMALVTRAHQQADPELEALIEDIELRARVELAKLGRYSG
ncbi:MAG TPA: flagellar assembly regulator FliX [Devosia sp.]|nr:flagellar assembly regulator FliX [Devosia sp.]